MTLSVIVVAAGSGERLQAASPKAFVPLGGKTLLEHCLTPLLGLDHPLQVIVVAPEGWETPAETLARSVLDSDQTERAIDLSVVTGGASRTESVRRGLALVSKAADYVLIHDAARALTPTDVFQRVVDALKEGHPGVIPVLPVVDTIVPVDPSTAVTAEAHPRDALGAVQTPQGFHHQALRHAYDEFVGDATDDAAVFRAAGGDVRAVPGHREGLKVTYPEDLVTLELLAGVAPAMAPGGVAGVLVGTGVDVHQFDADKGLVLGGMEFHGVPGLAGHSDGDVIVHAMTDALLAAASLGDLGAHFGVDRPEYEGVSSTTLLRHALGLLQDAGFAPASVSVQYIANHPKIGPVREEMCRALSGLVGAPVHVAGTTTDGLGLTGRGEGAAAIATALVVPHKLV